MHHGQMHVEQLHRRQRVHTDQNTLIAFFKFTGQDRFCLFKGHLFNALRFPLRQAQGVQQRVIQRVALPLTFSNERLSRHIRLKLTQFALHAALILPDVDGKRDDCFNDFRQIGRAVAHSKADG